jgi:FAD-linked sulfhydryl oxidase
MDPSRWGPHFWISIHAVAATYPEEPTEDDRAQYATYFTSLSRVLPCVECRQEFRTVLSRTVPLRPEDLASRAKLFEWTWRIHNLVNARLGAPQFPLRLAYSKYAVS